MNCIFQNGQKVHYCSRVGQNENGVVKTQCDDGVHYFVVYNCNEDWDNYQNYTAARTHVSDLEGGWI